MTAPSALVVERPSDGVALVRLNRPDRLNAINEALLGELTDTCAAIAVDESVRVVVLTGAGRGFCSGIDLRDFGPSMLDENAPAIDRLRFQEKMASLPQAIRALPQPVVAAVNGPAVGGGLALCLAADVRICAESASFGNAAKQALEKIGKSPEEVDLWEINEAFASVALNSMRMLGVDEENVNVNGGAIALGHPIGASGSRIVGSLVHELGRRGGGLGVAAICSGGGQGDAIVIEVPGS